MSRANHPSSALPDLDCVCATVRRAARLVTQLYDEELRTRLPASQFALLSAIDSHPGANQKLIARALAFDKTTLSRNLTLLERKGWIVQTDTTDQRERAFRMTPAGQARLAVARPAWKRAQDRLHSAMTGQQWQDTWTALRTLTNAAHHASGQGVEE
jgi:DNA-binding MarR family transcriptional regulator